MILGGRYRIDELLGQGGMSAVYKAYDPNLKRVVAVKTIHTHLADDPKFLSRFEEEAAAVAQLRHPNIVQVFDFNHDGDLYYMVQEYIAGETLEERLRRLNKAGKRMPLEEAVQSIVQVCQAAGYAHQRGMIHRDIKPANIMLNVHGEAILMDFGIVKITGAERHTATGAVVGTARYIPPEMIRGEVPDQRSDIYSLGATLFEMLTGDPPFEADSAMALMMMHLNDPPPDMRRLRPDAPDALIAVVEKSLAKSREGRFASMAEMAATLGGSLSSPSQGNLVEATLVDGTGGTAMPAVPGGIGNDGHTLMDQPPAQVDSAALVSPEAGQGAMEGLRQPPVLPSRPVVGDDGGSSPSQMAVPSLGQPPARRNINLVVGIGAGIVLLLLVLSGIFLAPRLFNTASSTLPTASPTDSSTEAALLIPTVTATATIADTNTPVPSPTQTPNPGPSATQYLYSYPQQFTSTPTIPVGVPFARILAINLDNEGRYQVEYETFEFTENLEGLHVHFYFNTVPQEEAGPPSQGPYYIWGGPRPFNGVRQVERPELASQLCVRVVNPDHSVHLDSGNCAVLPDVVVAIPTQETDCRLGPSPQYPTLTVLPAGEVALVLGISPDESAWNVANPQNLDEDCWLLQTATTISGDISTLPLIQPPPLPTGAVPGSLSVEITGITIDENGHYVVEYITVGFTEQLPGTHMHFFFDTIPPEEVGGISGAGNRLMYGGPSPFTGYGTLDRPGEAGKLCVLVANPDHSVVPDSGNCFPLPDAQGP